MNPAIIIIIGLVILCILSTILTKFTKTTKPKQTQMIKPPMPTNPTPTNPNLQCKIQYKKRPFLMTKNEFAFYKALLPVATSKNLVVFSKVRIADLLEAIEGPNWQSDFNKISQKHVDFVLCETNHIRPLLIIELDDNSHQRQDRDNRDIFVDKAFASAGLPIIHTLSSLGLSEKIDAHIKPPKTITM